MEKAEIKKEELKQEIVKMVAMTSMIFYKLWAYKKAPAFGTNEILRREQGRCPNDSMIIDLFVSEFKSKQKKWRLWKSAPAASGEDENRDGVQSTL